jgi:hypothetical protein
MKIRFTVVVTALALCLGCLFTSTSCGPFNGTTQPAPDMIQITAASNRAFAATERTTADALALGLLPESDRPVIQDSAKVARRWLDQMGIDARANNQLSFQNSLREFSVAMTPLIVRQVEAEQKKKNISPTSQPRPR